MDRDEKLSRLADDLEQVKSAITRSATVLREVAGPWHYRWMVGYLGVAVVAFSLLFHFVPRAYGGFAATPAWARALLVVGAIAATLAGSVVKLLTVGRLAQSVDRRLTFLSFFRRYYAPLVAHLYPPLILITDRGVRVARGHRPGVRHRRHDRPVRGPHAQPPGRQPPPDRVPRVRVLDAARRGGEPLRAGPSGRAVVGHRVRRRQPRLHARPR